MAQTKIHPALRLLPSLTDAAFILPIAFIFCRLNGAKTMLADCDTGWHIRAGEWILAHGRVPSTDMFSFTMPGAPWYAWEWLWEALFAWINRHAGMAGVVLASVAIISLTFALLFRLVRRKSGNVLIAFVVTMLAMGASSLHWLARPHLFTFLFLVIFYALLERAKDAGDSGRRLLWLLPAITVLWTNLHGGFFTGILLIGTYAAGEFTTWVVSGDAEERRAALARGARYLATAFGCFLASFINPYSYKLHSHIIEFLRDPYQYEHISEFLSLNFHHPFGAVFEIVIVLGVVAACWSVYRRQFGYVYLIVGWIHLALVSQRNIAVYAILAAPVVGAALSDISGALRSARLAPWIGRAAVAFDGLAGELDETDRIARLHLASAAVLVLVGAVLYAPQAPGKFRAEFDPDLYPAAALKVLNASSGSHRIFTPDEWGDYLIYRLYPKTKVFVDGRSDFYGTAFEEKYQSVLNVKYDWEKTLAGYGIDTILLPPRAPLATTVKQSRNWRPVYDDGIAIVFRAQHGASGDNRVSTASADSGKGHDRTASRVPRRDRAVIKSQT